MPTPTKLNLVLETTQGTMLILLWQQFLYAKENDRDGATSCFMEAVKLCRDQEAAAIGLGERMEHMHMIVGCGEGCQHKTEGA